MSILEDRTLKPNKSGFIRFAPVIAVIFVLIIVLAFVPLPTFVRYTIISLILAIILGLLAFKALKFFGQENQELREYEKEMRKRGRR